MLVIPTMIPCFLLLLLVATSFGRVLHDSVDYCSVNEYACGDGACVSTDRLCDGVRNCADGADEAMCDPFSNHLLNESTTLHRIKRQAVACTKYTWKCRDGTCVGFDEVCDGAVNCPDGSDETHAQCRKNKCQLNWFRCTYGACVNSEARCNGVKDCADNSDELHPKCFKEPLEANGRFKCANGKTIPSLNRCDGTADCEDKSDESVRACASEQCPSYLFQCAYGACVDRGSDCDGKIDCADGSDEDDELCNRIGTGTTTTTTIKPSVEGKCVLPPYPDHGSYVVGGVPNATPGQAFDVVQLNITCKNNYRPSGQSEMICFNGIWNGEVPKCILFCRLNKHASVEYRCLLRGSAQGTRLCNDLEPSGTTVAPECKKPNYYSSDVLQYMRCIDGSWDYIAKCSPECGRVTPSGKELVYGGVSAIRGELPWHTGIYTKRSKPYMQICGGSIVSTTVVISAAHCFWNELNHVAHPASDYAVAAGKIYRPWDNERETDAQKSDVSELRIPPRFQGAAANFQEDIALVFVTVPFMYQTFIRPVCLDFDVQFDKRQLQHGVLGKVAGWGYLGANEDSSGVLKVANLPYVKIDECISESPAGFREYITSDKICAGYRNGTAALCKGDSGGGLVFPDSGKGTERFYLRGIVSTVPSDENKCNIYAMTSFTHLINHENFILEYLTP